MISILHAGLPEVRPKGLIQRFAHLERGLVRHLDGGREIEMSMKRSGSKDRKGRVRKMSKKSIQREKERVRERENN